MIFRNDNYKCIHIIKDAHLTHINGFVEFKNDLIGSYSLDGKIVVWSFWFLITIFYLLSHNDK